jgi:hypothetical protein
MSTLTIRVTEAGIKNVTARVKSVAEADRIGRLSAAIALPLSLLHRTVLEFAGREGLTSVDTTVPVTVIKDV